MGITMAAAALATWAYFGLSWSQVIVVAVACGLSSTAISVKLYQDMGIAASSGARLALGIAIFQDIFIIFFLVILPALMATGAGGGALAPVLFGVVAKGAVFLGVAVLLARYVIPHVLHAVAMTKSRELFTLTVAGLCMGVAFLAALMGLSVVLGAFVAGLAVSECMYKHRILSDVAPIKDLFLTIFFVSVGLGIEIAPLLKDWGIVLSVAGGLIVGKALLIAVIARFLGLSWRAASAHTAQSSARSSRSPGRSSRSSSAVAGSTRSGVAAEAESAGARQISTALCSGNSSQPSRAPLAR
jgi:CPA2 family monovalent cation:H+ antiporter-2